MSLSEYIKIGADPEFIFRNQDGEMVNADTILQNGDMGLDGHRATGELRPKPASNALQLVANVRKLIRKGQEHEDVKALDMLAGHYKFNTPIGGHIHISGFQMDMNVLSSRLELVLMTLSKAIDNMEERRARKGAGYGDAESAPYRTQSTNWIEFRRPGSWLLSPQVAFANIWLAEAVCYAYTGAQSDRPFLDLKGKKEATDGIIAFANHMTHVPNSDIFFQVADGLFNRLPLDWNVDSKEAWE